MSEATQGAAVTIGVGVVVLAIRTFAWWLTGSSALFSDAAETVVNVAAGAIAFGALTLAAKPADDNHPYGHDKAEFFAAVIEGVMIVVAALVILHHAYGSYLTPTPIDQPLTGMVLSGIGTLINAGWSFVLLRKATRLRSPALAADAKHLFSDVVASTGILLGVLVVVLTGVVWLDPGIAALTALYILVSGFNVVRKSVGGLMDEAPPPDFIGRVRELVGLHAEGAIEAHDLRMRHAGRLTFLEFHLVVPAAMTVADAHEICDRIEAALGSEVDGLKTTIHVEPEAKAKHHGVIVV